MVHTIAHIFGWMAGWFFAFLFCLWSGPEKDSSGKKFDEFAVIFGCSIMASAITAVVFAFVYW